MGLADFAKRQNLPIPSPYFPPRLGVGGVDYNKLKLLRDLIPRQLAWEVVYIK